jgi:beta-alanine--pyruvate transaminase
MRAYEAGILVRSAGDMTAMSPPLIIEKSHIDELIGTLGKVIRETQA